MEREDKRVPELTVVYYSETVTSNNILLLYLQGFEWGCTCEAIRVD